MAEKMEFSALPDGADEALKVEVSFDFGESVEDALGIHAEEDVMYFFKRGVKSFLGMKVRSMIVAGSDEKAIQATLDSLDLSKRGRERMSEEDKAYKKVMTLSDEERAALIARLQSA